MIMENTVYIETYSAPPIDMGEVMRYAGVKELTDDMDALFRECIEEIKDKLSYKVCYKEAVLSFREDYTNIGFMRTNSKDIRKMLENASSAIVFAATTGIELDRLIKKYSVLSPSRALCFQAIGTERIESLCNAFCKDISQRKAAEGKSLTPRFSPGYGDFTIEAQRDIFTLLSPSAKIGLSLNESLIMSPSKSVTAIMGVSEGGCADIKKQGCTACGKLGCEFRRKE